MAKLQVYWTSLCPALTVRCSTSRSLDVGDEFWSWNMKDCENCPRQRRRIRRSYKYVWMYKIYELFQLNLWFPWGYCLLQLLIFMQAFASQLAEISLQPSCMFDVFRSRCRMWQEWTFAQPAMMRNSIPTQPTTAPHKIPVVYWVSPGSTWEYSVSLNWKDLQSYLRYWEFQGLDACTSGTVTGSYKWKGSCCSFLISISFFTCCHVLMHSPPRLSCQLLWLSSRQAVCIVIPPLDPPAYSMPFSICEKRCKTESSCNGLKKTRRRHRCGP